MPYVIEPKQALNATNLLVCSKEHSIVPRQLPNQMIKAARGLQKVTKLPETDPRNEG